jgi:hypothetical protein
MRPRLRRDARHAAGIAYFYLDDLSDEMSRARLSHNIGL